MLVDTPGIFAPNRRLDRAMVKAAWEGAEDADRVLLVIDAAAKLGSKVEQVIEGVAARPEPRILVLNKVDIAKKNDLLLLATTLSERLQPEAVFMAEDGLFFRKVAEVSEASRVPVVAILLQGAVAIAIALSGTYGQILSYVVSVDFIWFGLTGAALFVFRRRDRASPGFRAPGHPFTTGLFVVA